MGVFEYFPYTNFHELNLDWVLQQMKTLADQWGLTETQWNEMHEYITNYFNNLNVQNEINNKINNMIADGSFSTILNGIIDSEVGPVFVDSTEDMTDPTKIYALKSNGNLYYYNGSSFVYSGLSYTTPSTLIVSYGKTFSSVPAAPYNDFNTLPNNTILFYTNKAIRGCLNTPTLTGSYYWSIITFNAVPQQHSGQTQLAINYSNELHFRMHYTTRDGDLWSDWTLLSPPKEYKEYNIVTNINKPITLDNTKNILFAGDSITRGYISGTEISPRPWPERLKETFNYTYKNVAVAGAVYSPARDLKTIQEEIENETLNNYDYIFIAAGTNDWGENTNITNFTNSFIALCEYLTTNYNSKNVIFITPISRTSSSNNTHSLNEYSQIICEYALANGFSVINGFNFGFPFISGSVQNILIPDGTHPSEIGYDIYTNGVSSALI